MKPYPLTLVRRIVSYPVPPVCSVYWSAADWARMARVSCEPLVIDSLGWTFVATGERNDRGQLLYRMSNGH